MKRAARIKVFGWPNAVIAAVCTASLLLISTGCSLSGDGSDQRVGVQGSVSLDGKPVEAAAILFHCGAGEAQVSAVGYVVDGTYEIPPEEGPLVGTARVEFVPQPVSQDAMEMALEHEGPPRGRPKYIVTPIPRRYGPDSKLTVDVTDSEENTFDFDLQSRS